MRDQSPNPDETRADETLTGSPGDASAAGEERSSSPEGWSSSRDEDGPRASAQALVFALAAVGVVLAALVFVLLRRGDELPRTDVGAIRTETFAGIEMIWIPPGSFTMGSRRGEDHEQPPHTVTISQGFWMGRYEVTQAQWKKYMDKIPVEYEGDDLPVEAVTWNLVQEFIQRLNASGDGGPGGAFRLPTEAEWEYACRAGSTSEFCFGNDESRLGDYAWFNGNSDYKTHPVGAKRPNAWGLFDMHGNVWEWCSDWYGEDYYANSPDTDPAGPDAGVYKVLRGGCWYYDAALCRSAYRYYITPVFRNSDNGFRLARTP